MWAAKRRSGRVPMIWIMLIAGLTVLVAGAELLVRGAAALALRIGIAPLVVGLTVVSFGTSSPELAVSIDSALGGQGDISLGNVVGSNILNVLFILGVSALIVPLLVHRQLVRQEVPIMIALSLLLFVLAADGRVSRVDGALFCILLAAYLLFLYFQGRRRGAEEREESIPASGGRHGHWAKSVLLVAAGLGLLVLGAHWFVDAATAIARMLGLSDLVIGLTIVALGTSLPEVATSIVAAVRGQRDIAVGNVVGSNIFNILGVLGIAAAVAPEGLVVSKALLTFDLPVMIAVAVACLPIFFTGQTIARWEGGVFVGYYAAYTVYVLLNAQQHDLLDRYTLAMRWVVLPLTTLTIVLVAEREWRHRRKRRYSQGA